jgi:hypothetical protein
MKKWREAETQHGRVAMLATLGMLVVEEPIEYHPLVSFMYVILVISN